jgi:hypothetical protein
MDSERNRDIDHMVVGDIILHHLSWGGLGTRTDTALEELLGLADRMGVRVRDNHMG